jgi:hypothetical protein
MKNDLAAMVAAVNRANACGVEMYRKLATVFKPLVGQKILKADGTLLAKYQALLPELPSTVALSVFRHTSDYLLVWTVKTCEMVPPYSRVYHEVTVYVGSLSGKILRDIMEPFTGRTDWTVEEVTAKRAAYKVAKEAAETAHSALCPDFGY